MVRAATLRNRVAKGRGDDDLPWEQDEKEQKSTSDEVPCKGIVNLGNTCFFNSVLQNLVRTDAFRTSVLVCFLRPACM
jgi:uncharacterized UBP type Zn finger protein